MIERIRSYELMAIFSPDVTEEDLPGAIDRVRGYIETAGGTVLSINQESPWGRRRLAYAIRYQGRDVRDGYYVLYFFDVASSQIAEIEREIGLNDRLIRHILTIRGETPAAPEEEGAAEGEQAASPETTGEQPAGTETPATAASQGEPEAPTVPAGVEPEAVAEGGPEAAAPEAEIVLVAVEPDSGDVLVVEIPIAGPEAPES